MTDSADDREWRFAVEDVGPEAEADDGTAEATTAAEDGDDADDLTGETAAFLQKRPVEPQSLNVENAAFVALGVIIGIVGVMMLFVDPMGFGLIDIAVVSGFVAVAAALLFFLFGRATPDT
jgi:hypothetical protein